MAYSITKKDASILIGNTVDHFDTALYSFLAPMIAPLFFPNSQGLVQLILAYSILATSLFTRPIGAYLFGVIAKNHGPVLGLSYSLIGVAITTVAIGFIPEYATIGEFAPLSLIIIRMIRGIFAAGESTIAKLYILEDKSKPRAFTAAYLYQASSMLGIVLASLASTIVIATGEKEAWRVCFWLGGSAGFIGYFLRQYATKNNEISNEETFAAYNFSSIYLLWFHKLKLARVAIVTGFSHLTYTIPFVVMNNFIPFITSISLPAMMALNTILLVFDMIMIPIVGRLLRKHSPAKVMISSAAILGITIIPLWSGLYDASLWYVTFVRFWIVLWGVVFLCPVNLWFKELFNSSEQYLVIGMGAALGTATIGRLTPVICLSLWYMTGSSLSIAVYILAITLLTLLAILR